jgi:L-lactate dehydrogenase complex protein LldG
MGDEHSRDAMIARVRRAVAACPVEADRPRPLARPAAQSSSALVKRFVGEAEAAEAFVSIAADAEGALQRVADILSEFGAQQVVVSADAWDAPWNVARLSDVIEECTVRRTSSQNDPSATAIARSAAVGVTAAAYGIAETGTLVLCGGPEGGRIESLLPPAHIALLPVGRVVADLPEVLEALERDHEFERSSAVTLITGPSRTADIELTLTIGVHGPKQLFIILVHDPGVRS